jgi:hypothetical protein
LLKSILKFISRKGYISRSHLSKELGVAEEVVGDGIAHLLRMGYLLEEDSGNDCAVFCTNCPFAQNCSKEIVKFYRISDKGNRYLGKEV